MSVDQPTHISTVHSTKNVQKKERYPRRASLKKMVKIVVMS